MNQIPKSMSKGYTYVSRNHFTTFPIFLNQMCNSHPEVLHALGFHLYLWHWIWPSTSLIIENVRRDSPPDRKNTTFPAILYLRPELDVRASLEKLDSAISCWLGAAYKLKVKDWELGCSRSDHVFVLNRSGLRRELLKGHASKIWGVFWKSFSVAKSHQCR